MTYDLVDVGPDTVMGIGDLTLRMTLWIGAWIRSVSLTTCALSDSFCRFSYVNGGRSSPSTLFCSSSNCSWISGRVARRIMIHADVDEDECWPAINSAIIMCATSTSGTGVPSLYVQDIRFQIMSSSFLSTAPLLRSLMMSMYVCAIFFCA